MLLLHYAEPDLLLAHRAFLEDPRPNRLPPPLRPPVSSQEAGWKLTLEALGERASAPIERLWIGSEFCPFLYWSRADVEVASGLLESLRLPASLVLGPVFPDQSDQVPALVDEFVSRVPDAEVVVNDWGTAAGLVRRGVPVEPGRLLFRSKRLPRFGRSLPEPAGVEGTSVESIRAAQVKELSADPLGWEPYRRFLEELGVNRYVVEPTPQGFRPELSVGLGRSLLLPWSAVTSGGRCPIFAPVEGGGCRRDCRRDEILPQYREPTWPIVQAGGAVFLQAAAIAAAYLKMSCWDRVILEPWIPM